MRKKNAVFLLLLFATLILLVGCGGKENQEEENSAPDVALPVEATPPAEPAATSLDDILVASQSSMETNQTDTDWDIITRPGHPTYYGSVAQSHAVWDDVPKGKIVFADSLSKWGDQSILSMDCYRNSDLIRNVYVSLSQFEVPISVTVDEVLPTVATYMPYDIMSQYYERLRSWRILPDAQAASDDIYYVISYALTNDGKAAYASHEHEYSGTIDVIIKTNSDGIVQNFSIGFGTPKWMSFLTTNSRHSEEWYCDLFDYQ